MTCFFVQQHRLLLLHSFVCSFSRPSWLSSSFQYRFTGAAKFCNSRKDECCLLLQNHLMIQQDGFVGHLAERKRSFFDLFDVPCSVKFASTLSGIKNAKQKQLNWMWLTRQIAFMSRKKFTQKMRESRKSFQNKQNGLETETINLRKTQIKKMMGNYLEDCDSKWSRS